jgi:hypothetical protein
MKKMLENQYIEYISTRDLVGRKKQNPVRNESGFADKILFNFLLPNFF